MSISCGAGGASLGAWEALAGEYVARASRLAPLRARPLPHNLALELTRSILYETADSLDAAAGQLRSRDDRSSHADSLWNGKPQQYFESLTFGGEPPDDAGYDADSLAP